MVRLWSLTVWAFLVVLLASRGNVVGARNNLVGRDGGQTRTLSGSFTITPLHNGVKGDNGERPQQPEQEQKGAGVQTDPVNDCVQRSVGRGDMGDLMTDVVEHNPEGEESRAQEGVFDTEGSPKKWSSGCLVPPELKPSNPECTISSAGISGLRASTQTCNMTTVIPESKMGSCGLDAQASLDAHNAARRRRGAAPLLWSRTLARTAQAVADACVLSESTSIYGQNFAIGDGLTCSNAVDVWLQEETIYPIGGVPGFSWDTASFTQIMWKDTLQVGCAISNCSETKHVVCQYYPAGNYIGQFFTEVGENGEPNPCEMVDSPYLPPVPAPPPLTPPPPPQRCCIWRFCYRC